MPSLSIIDGVTLVLPNGFPFKVSLLYTEAVLPPSKPSTGIAVKSSSTASIVAAPTATVIGAEPQLPGFKFSQIVYTMV